MENPNWSMVELEGPTKDDFLITTDSLGSGRTRDKGHRGRKNAKQLTWVLMLKAHRAAGCLTSIAFAMFGLTALIRHRLALGRTNYDEIKNENDDASVEGMGIETVKILAQKELRLAQKFCLVRKKALGKFFICSVNFLRKQTMFIYIIGL